MASENAAVARHASTGRPCGTSTVDNRERHSAKSHRATDPMFGQACKADDESAQLRVKRALHLPNLGWVGRLKAAAIQLNLLKKVVAGRVGTSHA